MLECLPDRSASSQILIQPMTQPGLALYVTPLCGFCHYVMSAIRQLGLEVEIRDITANRDYLVALYHARGRTTVPVLRITTPQGEQWLPESRDIVRYLQDLKAAVDAE